MSTPSWPAPSDPGLQPERTALAWTRTACSALVVGLLGVRWAGALGWWFIAVTVFATALVLAVLARARTRMARLGHGLTGASEARMASASVLAMTLGVVLVGVAAAVVVLLA